MSESDKKESDDIYAVIERLRNEINNLNIEQKGKDKMLNSLSLIEFGVDVLSALDEDEI